MSRDKVNLKYYIFDWDDNILHMSTKIIMEKLNHDDGNWNIVDVPTSDFTEARQDTDNYRIPLNEDGTPNFDLAFENFRDTGQKGEDAFVHDMIEAIDDEKFGVSYKAFKKCLVNGNLFAIVTARGHEPETIKRGIMYFIETQLNEEEKITMRLHLEYYCYIFGVKIEPNKLLENYLSICEYIGVSSEYFINSVSEDDLPENETFTPSNTELSKKIAVERFCKKCVNFSELMSDRVSLIEIGFSDDDRGNVVSIENLFMEKLNVQYPEVSFNIYDTSKNEDDSINYDRITI
jgi:hypothetical protein